MVLFFIIAALISNLVFLLMLSEIRNEVIEYIIKRRDDEDT
jgi:hypothetical protein